MRTLVTIASMKNPIYLFSQWHNAAQEKEINDPCAMFLATATSDNIPHLRVIKLTSHDENGFYFSADIPDLAENNNAALCFYWNRSARQIRIEGEVSSTLDRQNFCLSPKKIEFWQDKKYRLHKREVYRKEGDRWKVEVLYP